MFTQMVWEAESLAPEVRYLAGWVSHGDSYTDLNAELKVDKRGGVDEDGRECSIKSGGGAEHRRGSQLRPGARRLISGLRSRVAMVSYLKLCHLSPPFPLLWVRVTMESTSRGSCMEKLS